MILIADMQAGGIGGLGAALAAGFIFSLSPVSFAVIPAVAAYVTKARASREAIILGSAFILGMVLTHMALGILAAAGGKGLQQLIGPAWHLITGPILVLLGFMWIGWLRVPLPWMALQGKRVATAGGAFALAIPFTVGVCPACSPGFWIALGASAVVGSAGYGALLLLMFAIGRVIPILLGVISISWLETLRPISGWRRILETVGGCILIVLGVYLLNDYYQWV